MTTFEISYDAQKWLATGERGVSSNAIFSHLTGLEIAGHRAWDDTPSDPADLRRCRLLLECVPEFIPRFPEMASRSDMWAKLVQEWDSLCRVMDMEIPEWRIGWSGSATKTYKRMKEIGL